MKILAIGAHPDDIEYGCYGTLRKHLDKGANIYYLVLTLGGDSGNPKVRKREQVKTSLGPVIFGGLTSAFLSNNSGRESISLIEQQIEKRNPDIIFTHSFNDRHQDHKAVNSATISACRFFQGKLFFYEGYSSLKLFKPNCISKIDGYFLEKINTIERFTSQSKKFYMSPKIIESIAVFRAAQFGFLGMAEAFEAGRVVL